MKKAIAELIQSGFTASEAETIYGEVKRLLSPTEIARIMDEHLTV